MLKGCGRAVPALCSVPKGAGKRWGCTQKERPPALHKRPKSREETPKEGCDSGVGCGGRYRIPLAKTIAISGSIERRDHGPIRRFMALAFKAEHYRNGQAEKSGRATGKSALPSITDFVRGHQHVSKCQKRKCAVVCKHCGNASTRRCNATHPPRNCVAPTLTMQELLRGEAGRLMSV